jgi:Flp pilus assembly protein TadG
LAEKTRRFLSDRAGSVTVEFVIALPILLAILAFSVQYGNALKVRNNLDVASRDAARYLARAPLNAGATDVDVYFKTKARQIVSARVEKTKSTISSFTPVSDATSASVAVTIDVPFPLLRWIGLFSGASPTLSMSSSESWERTGDGITTTSSSGGT